MGGVFLYNRAIRNWLIDLRGMRGLSNHFLIESPFDTGTVLQGNGTLVALRGMNE